MATTYRFWPEAVRHTRSYTPIPNALAHRDFQAIHPDQDVATAGQVAHEARIDRDLQLVGRDIQAKIRRAGHSGTLLLTAASRPALSIRTQVGGPCS